jgi:hypothetical protein
MGIDEAAQEAKSDAFLSRVVRELAVFVGQLMQDGLILI